MRDDDFAIWLDETHKTKSGGRLTVKAQGDAVSRCRRIEKYEGDLDKHFSSDEMAGLLRRLDMKTHEIPIGGKNVAKSEATLKSAANSYHSFCLCYPP